MQGNGLEYFSESSKKNKNKERTQKISAKWSQDLQISSTIYPKSSRNQVLRERFMLEYEGCRSIGASLLSPPQHKDTIPGSIRIKHQVKSLACPQDINAHLYYPIC